MQEPFKFCSVCGAGMNIGGEVCERCQSRVSASSQTAYQPAYSEKFQSRQEVVVTDFNMSFWSMVIFMVKWAVAAIPAMIILFFMVIILLAILSGMRGSVN